MSIIRCQHEWVEQCQLRYKVEPPTGYHFEEAHYPLSRKLGGTSTISLWFPDHIIQGCLQTINLDYPCINVRKRGIERPIVESVYPNLLSLYDEAYLFCQRFAAKRGGKVAGTKAASSGQLQSAREMRDPKEHSDWGKELGRRNVENGHLARISKLGGAKGGKAASSIRVMCTVTGHISNPGGLTHYQRKRGIDTSLRVKLQ